MTARRAPGTPAASTWLSRWSGEACLLLAFALLAAAAPGDSLAIRDVAAALPGRAGARRRSSACCSPASG